MNRILVVTLTFILFSSTAVMAGFDDLLKDVLVETVGATSQQQAIGTNEYTFSPGEPVIQKETFAIYYSGSEGMGAEATLLLTLVEQNTPILLKYPNPQTIRAKGFTLQVLAFDNTRLRVKLLSRS